MRYTPKNIEENFNVSRGSRVAELLRLTIGLVIMVFGIYLLLGFTVDLIVPYISPKLERSLFKDNYKSKSYKTKTPDAIYLQKILNKLTANLDEKEKSDYQILFSENDELNAFALPDGKILVYKGLLKQAESENELAFVLAHELGHFAHRDHLKGLGRRLVLIFVSSLFFSSDENPVNKIFRQSLSITHLKFSQKQESNADLYGLALLNKTYGHVGGAADLMDRLKQGEKNSLFLPFVSTHPPSAERSKMLQQTIQKHHYQLKKKFPIVVE